jgi:hypothetical protein
MMHQIPVTYASPSGSTAGLAKIMRFSRLIAFQFPYWWSNLLTGLDSLSRLGFEIEDSDIVQGMDWFIAHQKEDGLWPTGYGSGQKAEANRRWIGLAICRMLKKFYQGAYS